MSDFDINKIRRLDGGLLLVFLGLMRHRKATRVAAELGLTNSSISHALTRLRDIFDDQLFLRQPHGLEPTAFALALEAPVQKVVDTLADTLSEARQFDPATSQSQVRLSAHDSEIASLISPLVSELRQAAPGIRVSAVSLTKGEALAALRDRQIDLALGFFVGEDDAHVKVTLARDDYCVVARKGHHVLQAGLSLKGYLEAEHVLVSQDSSLRGIVDSVLADRGLHRRVAVSVPFFMSALVVVSGTDLIATLPSRLAQSYAAQFGLSVAAPPLEIRSFDIHAVRHKRDEKQPILMWLTERLKKIALETR